MPAEEVRVVVVDGMRDAAEVLAGFLQLNGYRVCVVTDAEHALAVIATRRLQCVLFDVLMPGINGAVLAKRPRERYNDEIVLIAVTGLADSDRRAAEAFAMADHYLRNPVDLAIREKLLPQVDRR